MPLVRPPYLGNPEHDSWMNQVTQILNTQLKPESNNIEEIGGTTGLVGADGIDAAHYAEITLYTDPAVSSPPSAPTATFTWFTAILSSVTAGWSQTPPTIDPTSPNTVYYSKITFFDSLAPFATTTDTGSTPVALYNFSGLAVSEEDFTTVLKGKLDGIEALADVTDVTNVTAAGALMDSEVTNLAQVKAFSSADYATAAQGTTADAALPKAGGAMSGAITTTSTFDGRDVSVDGAKLDGIEALADVTDVTNVTAAGALMDSEVDADIKTLVLPASTTISIFGASLVDDLTNTAARTTLGLGTAATTASTAYATAAQGTTADAALPKAGGTMTGAIDGVTTLTADMIQLTGGTGTQGQVSWNADEETLDLINNGAVLQMGQEMHVHSRNNTGVTIAEGVPVMASGTLGASGRILITPMVGSVQANAKYLIGITTEEIPTGTDGKATQFGKVRGIDTTGTPYGETWVDGDVLWIDPVTTGGLTNVEPTSTSDMAQSVAFVVNSHVNVGELMVRVSGQDEHGPLQHTLLKTGGAMTGAITTNSTFDGRDVATDGTKLDGIETGATADQVGLVKGADIGGSIDLDTYTTDGYFHQNTNANATSGTNYPVTLAGMLSVQADGNMVYQKYQTYNGDGTWQRTKYISTWRAWDKILDTGNSVTFTSADRTKLDGIEALADVTDVTNVTAAGALMDSELTSIASVKALNQGVATTDSPTFAVVTAGDVNITGPTPILKLTDNDFADEYTKIQNSGGGTFIDSRNGTANGPIILRGQGGGVSDEYARFISSGNFGIGDTSPAEALSVTGNIAATGSVVSQDEVRAEVVSYASNQDAPYMVAATTGYTGATTNWGTYGFQHRLKSNGSGTPRITVDDNAAELYSLAGNGDAIFAGTVTATSYTGDGSALTGMKLSSASFKNTTGGQTVNFTSFTKLTDWADDGVDAAQYSAASGVITLTRGGTFLVSVTVAAESLLPTSNYRWTGEMQLWKNGTTDVARTSGGYIRGATGSTETSFSLTKVLTFAASDTLAIRVRRISNATGDATTIPSQCHLSFVEL